jgi:hypothetical protein
MVRKGRKTISESVYSDRYEFVELAKNWRPDAITIILNLIWQGYDLDKGDVLSKIDLSQAYDQLERDITQSLSVYIEQAKSGFEPFVIRSEWFEMQTREQSPARPKQYDLAFVWSNPANVRIVWPIEAKVLRSDSSVTEYVNEITGNYLTCRYAPFSSEVGMLGYLLRGSSTIAFNNIGTAVPCTLSDHPDFLERQHKVSDHTRTVPMGERYPVKFRCHHLLLELTKKTNVQKATAKRKSSKKIPEN